ncbi:MAG: tRNA (adenosine(37)-N6)-threonylcarbamoyltransferase complex ATPase subunit type 1 TsaE [Desulfarculus sp.]|nr:tRNA (adenosine(37)-N6)-threonylcarbamoyltransferase complex ATPase subunit type 1 TsaE [Desulfarculus sp.]
MVKGAFVEAAQEARLELALAGEEQTVALGRALGGLLKAGDVVLLIGELGAGKTCLARGLAGGLGVDPAYVIQSPTFTLLNVYPGRLEFFHADLYRLGPGDAADLELLEQAAGGVLAVEWPERAPGMWPATALRVELGHDGQDRRRAVVSGPAGLVQRLKEIMNT